jgi:hypothetical protein
VWLNNLLAKSDVRSRRDEGVPAVLYGYWCQTHSCMAAS